MQNLTEPLSNEEIERLNALLLNRVDEDADFDAEDVDEGVLDISELDGFFTAIVSGPAVVMPARWLPAVWGSFPPVWAGKKDFEDAMSLMMRHMNNIASTLIERSSEFEPIFLEHVVEGETCAIVDEWCQGYLRGVALAAGAWNAGGPRIARLLEPIRSFTGETDWRGHEMPTEGEADQLRNAIAPNAREIHAYWLARRGTPVH